MAGDLVARLGVEHGRVEIRACFLRQRLAELVLQHARLHLLDRAFGEIAKLEGAERQADQPVHRQAEMFEHALDLAVFAFAQAHGEPDVGALHAIQMRFDAAIFHAFDHHALGERVELGLIHLAMGAHAIAAQPARGRQLQHAREPAVIGEQQQALGVDVEPAHGDDARKILGHGVENRRPAFGIAVGRHRAARLVKQEQARALTRADGAAVNGDLVGGRDVEGRALQRLAVDAHAAFGDPALCVAPRAQAGAGHDFRDAVAFRRVGLRRGRGRAGRRTFRFSLVGHADLIAECGREVE